MQFVTDAPQSTAAIMLLHQLVKLRLPSAAGQANLQLSWIRFSGLDIPEHGNGMANRGRKSSIRRFFIQITLSKK